jgi:hypothetical protein
MHAGVKDELTVAFLERVVEARQRRPVGRDPPCSAQLSVQLKQPMTTPTIGARRIVEAWNRKTHDEVSSLMDNRPTSP